MTDMFGEFRQRQGKSVLSSVEADTAAEVFSQYDGLQIDPAWDALNKRALETGPFKVYDSAHAIAASLTFQS